MIVPFFTAALTATVGMGGGMVLVVVMASFLPVAALIPVHGVVMLVANGSRTWFMRPHIDKKLLIPFALTSIPGSFAGAYFVVDVPDAVLKSMIAIFVLLAVWIPKIDMKPVIKSQNRSWLLGGFLTSFGNMIVGGGGILLAPFFSRSKMGRKTIVATHGACMTVQHGLKVVAFGALGFSFGAYLPLIAGMAVSAIFGSWVGKHLLNHFSDALFLRIFKITTSILALRLLYLAAL